MGLDFLAVASEMNLWEPEGDQAAHLMWRLQNGQLLKRRQPRVIVVMIGTNDLGAAACLGGARGIQKAARGTSERWDLALAVFTPKHTLLP
jgi:lysophospholipase L1-like esterase